MNLNLEDPVTNIPLVGPTYASKLENLGIQSVKDLIYHFPFRYTDSRDIITVSQLIERGEGTVKVSLSNIQNIRTRGRRFITKARAMDDSEEIEIVWFNQPYLKKTLKENETYLLKGKTNDKYGRISLSNPEYELLIEDTTHLGKLTPTYPETYGVSSKWLRSRIKPLKPLIDEIEDYLPKKIIEEEKVLDLKDAITKIHFPESTDDIKEARERIGLDELIEIQIKAQELIKKRQSHKAKTIKRNKKSLVEKFIDSLPFKLTDCQNSSIKEIQDDLEKESPMERLLNGDVGSGKTVVALAGALAAYENEYSTIIMAPTTILANQHYSTITSFFKLAGIDLPIKLLTSNQKVEFEETPQIIICTHAILYKNKIPENTAFVVVDEEHRFGVKQREEVSKQLKGIHRLTMTATPIPRTLTMTIYGEKNVSILDELPSGRKVVETHLVPEIKRENSYEWIEGHIKRGEQLFIIHPLIDSSEKIEAKAAKEEYEVIKNKFSKYGVGLVHGKLKEDEKNKVIQKFHNGEIDILVATPVIEVGIDIPNATMMIIENAERFGLAQLHQFRGRIGRNDKQSFCFIFYDSESKDVKDRLEYFSNNPNGFDVANYDLKRRGPGEVYGTRQSGLLNFRFADITNLKQVKRAARIAKQI